MNRPSGISLALLPQPDDTTVSIHPPVTYYGVDMENVVIRIGVADVQFRSPADALAWLAHCTNAIVAELEAKKVPA